MAELCPELILQPKAILVFS